MDLQQGNLGEKLCVMPRVLNGNTSFGLDDHAVKQIAMALKTLTTSLLLSSGSMGHPFRPNLKQDLSNCRHRSRIGLLMCTAWPLAGKALHGRNLDV